MPKIEQFQSAFKELLGLDLTAFTTKRDRGAGGGPFRGASADETPRSVMPGEDVPRTGSRRAGHRATRT